MNLPPTIAAHIDQFTGRTWLLPKVLDWYERNDERILLISGGPGTGKSMIMAWLAGFGPLPDEATARQQLARVRAQVKAAHFCVAASGSTAPRALAHNLAEQLTCKVPGFADALAASLADLVTITTVQRVERMEPGASMTGVQIGTLNLAGLGEELSFNRTLREPLQKLYENGYDEPVLLLVDALDEALTYTGVTDIVRLLAKLEDLPEHVRILASTRPDPRVLKRFGQTERVDLIEDAPPDVDDVQAYASGRLARVDGLSAAEIEAFASRIARAADGIFLYAAIVLDELLPRLPSMPDLEDLSLPEGLGGLYAGFMNRELGAEEERWYEQFEPVFGLIAVAQGEGLSRAQIEDINGHDARRTLRVCKQYLDGPLPDGPFRCFHRSFVEYLLEDEENVDYHIDGAQMHRRIADHYWQAHHPRWQGCDAYGLDSLATHLRLAGQEDQLKALISQAWMAARFEGSGYTYDGFVSDLMLAWQAVHEEAQRQAEARQAPAALADCVRSALIRTSINSLSARYAPALVARALETGLWPAERALSVARRVPSPEGRVRMLAALLATGYVNAEQSTQARRAGLEAALAIGDERSRAEALATLAPQLTGEALEQGLEAVLAVGDGRSRAEALAALAPQLTGEARAQALARGLEAALVIRDEWHRAEALAALAPQLTGEARAQALTRGLEAALAIEDDWRRESALAALVPQLAGELSARGLEGALAIWDERYRARALEAALAIEYEPRRADALAALAPLLTGELLARGLEAALAIGLEWYRVRALAALAPQLEGELLAQGLAAALAIEDEPWRAGVLAALAPQLAGELLARGLEGALAIKDGSSRAEALAALAPQLTGGARTQALEQGLEAALSIKDGTSRAGVLATLAPQLAGELLARGLEGALAIKDGSFRAKALATLAPQLTGKLLARGLEGALAIKDEKHRASALVGLASHLSGELLARGLEGALAIEYEWPRLQALVALAPQLTGEARVQALARGLEGALVIEHELPGARALVALAPHLAGKALERALDAALTIGDERFRAGALMVLAPQRALAKAIAFARAWARAAVLAIERAWFRARGLTARRELAAALAIGYGPWRAEALAALAPQLAGEARTQALEQALEAALAIGDERRRADALAALAPQLAGELLARGLEAALAVGHEKYRAWALVAFLPVAPDSGFFLSSARQAIADHLLNNLSTASRAGVLNFCAEEKLFAPPILDQDILDTIAGHIVEVCEEWRWM